MKVFSTPPAGSGADGPTVKVSCPTVCNCPHGSAAGVGQNRHSDISEGELDEHIRDLGRLSEKAMADGDPTGARLWTNRMVEAIARRSPQHQARVDSATADYLRDLNVAEAIGGCFFAAMGNVQGAKTGPEL